MDLVVHPGSSLVSQMQPPSSFPTFFGQVIAAASLAVFQPQSSYPAGGHQMSHQADGVSNPYPGDPNIMIPSQVSPTPLRAYQSSSTLAGLPESLSRLNFANLQGTQGGPPSWSSTEMGTRNSMVNGGHAGPNPDAFHRDNTTHQEKGQRKRRPMKPLIIPILILRGRGGRLLTSEARKISQVWSLFPDDYQYWQIWVLFLPLIRMARTLGSASG